MPRIRVKICGFTCVEEAAAAADYGADAVGLVFCSRSPRSVSVEVANGIVTTLPPFVTTVGLFVNESPEIIEAILHQVPLDLIQFHGDEKPEECTRFGRPYIKAIRMAADVDLYREAERYQDARALLLDAWHPALAGGTGECFDWDRIPSDLPLPVILAGGLNPENVRLAVQRVRPFAVDVSSGVEKAKGIKDPKKMADFIKEVTYGDSIRSA